MNQLPDYLPISTLNAYAYCPRRFYYEFILGEMVVNEHVLEGQQLHTRVDEAGLTSRGEKLQLRRVYLCASVLRLLGYADILEAVLGENPADEYKNLVSDSAALRDLALAGRLYPVEYKKGKMGKWLSDHTQLCAQALALEETLQIPPGTIKQGYIFYFGSAKREEVLITAELRERTLVILAEVKTLLLSSQTQPPSPLTNRQKCRDCSLEPICLPQEILQLQKIRGDLAKNQKLKGFASPACPK